LLGLIGVLAELDAVPAVDYQEITAFAALSERVRAAEHRHGHGPNGRQMRRGIDHQSTGRRDGSPLSGRFLLATCVSAKSQANQKKTTRYNSRFHMPASPIPEDYSFLCPSVPL
jgi:hypothetical protein